MKLFHAGRFVLRCTAFLTLLPLMLLPSCGGGSGGAGDSGGTAGDLVLMDADTRADAASAAFEKMNSLKKQGLPRDQVAAQMVAYINTHPSFAGAGYSAESENVWANFKDGVPFMVFDNLKPHPDVVPDPPPSRSPNTVPRSKQFRVMSSLGTGFASNDRATQKLLLEAGYSPASPFAVADIPHLMTDVKGDGFFMWAAGGGLYTSWKDGQSRIYGLSTQSLATAANERIDPYRSLLASGEIGVAYNLDHKATADEVASAGVNGRIDKNTYVQDGDYYARVYFISTKFIRNRFKLGENSVVIMNSPSSLKPELSGAFAAAGASAYLGWDRPAKAFATISYRAIDRMIGGSSAVPVPNPPQRPFNIAAVLGWMKEKGLNSYSDPEWGTPTFDFKLLGGSYGFLAPSIFYIDIAESPLKGDKAQMTLQGNFGTKDDTKYPRVLTVGGVPQTITDGAPGLIAADLDSTSYGDCVLKVGGRISNIVPITYWDIPVTVEATTEGSAGYVVLMHIKVRADVHKWRFQIDDVPEGNVPTAPVSLLMGNSTASWAASGTYSDGLCKHTISGGGTVSLPGPGQTGTAFLTGLGKVSGKDLTIEFSGLTLGNTTGVDALDCDGKPSTQNLLVVIPPALTFHLNPDTYKIEPGESPFVAGAFTLKASWKAVQPVSPPTNKTSS